MEKRLKLFLELFYKNQLFIQVNLVKSQKSLDTRKIISKKRKRKELGINYCQYCGAKILYKTGDFCSKCGAPLK